MQKTLSQNILEGRFLRLSLCLFGMTILLAQEPQLETIERKVLEATRETHKLTLTDSARNLGEVQFRAAAPRLKALIAGSGPAEQNLLVSFAIGEYLAELRDIKSGDDPSGRGQQLTIDESDLRKFPFAQFLGQRYPSESQPKGYLKVESVPTGAEIRIDDQPKGWTDKPFVIRPGQHRVSVTMRQSGLSCVDLVQVGRDQMVTFRCPRR
jgi:hypothetical protein